MELRGYLTFVFATALMILSPGPSVLLVIAHSISYGWRFALITVAGATAGIAVQLTVAAIGLASLLNTVAEAFTWLRWAGAAYLIYLGIKQWQGAGEPLEVDLASAPRTNLFVQGLVITTFNPKSLLFMATYLPQFVDPARALGVQFALIVPTFLVITFVVTSVWAVVAAKAGSLLQNQRAYRLVFRAAAAMMIVAGAGLVLVYLG